MREKATASTFHIVYTRNELDYSNGSLKKRIVKSSYPHDGPENQMSVTATTDSSNREVER